MIIYCATNKINNKKYIGQTGLSLEKRKKSHAHDCKYCDYVFGRALLKYEMDGFDWKIICECKSTKEMNNKEKELFYFMIHINQEKDIMLLQEENIKIKKVGNQYPNLYQKH